MGARQKEGASDGDAALVAIAVGLITYVFEDLNNRQALDEAKRQAVEDAGEQLKRRLSAIQARETNNLDHFAETYGWKRDKKGNFVDPFSRLEQDLKTRYFMARTSRDAIGVSKAILDAARRIPGGRLYDENRGNVLYWAARAATWAAQKEIQGQKWGSVKPHSAAYAVRLWDATFRYDPVDPSGLRRSQRAWALAIAGRMGEAIAQADEVSDVRRTNPAFLYHYACLLSCSRVRGNVAQRDFFGTRTEGNLGIAMNKLRAALAHGSIVSDLDSYDRINVNRARTDPNLEDLRNRRRDEFEELTRVKWNWHINWGVFNDDIVLVNQSAFPITNVTLSARIESGGRLWTRTLTAPSVEAGQAYPWKNVVSIPGSRVDKKSAYLTCDENK